MYRSLLRARIAKRKRQKRERDKLTAALFISFCDVVIDSFKDKNPELAASYTDIRKRLRDLDLQDEEQQKEVVL